ncbi:MAG TPA: hypothetical protein VGA17_08375 [Nitrospiraceae bacterium]
MTPFNDEDFKKVERVLSDAHRSRRDPSLNPDWALNVMRDVRREALRQGRSTMPLGLDRLVWRTAAMAAVLAVVFTGSVLIYSSGDAVELSTLFSSEFDATVALLE